MKKTYMYIKAIFALCLVSVFVYGQPTNTIVNDVVMPSPNAAAFGKYTEVPVNLSNGLPQIGVPIYTVTEGPLSFPIAASYHGSGVRVGELASWIGTNWALSADNMITRTVRGIPDEISGYYTQAQGLQINDQTIEDAAEGIIDSEPDIFTYSVGGYSGKFMYDELQREFLIPQTDVEIDVYHNNNRFEYFIITTPDGTKYYFGDLPGTSTNSGSDLSEVRFPGSTTTFPYSNNWYLVKIESYDSNYAINLAYEAQLYSYKSLASCTYTKMTGNCFIGISTELRCNGFSDDGGKTFYNIVHINGKRLKQITTSTGNITVDFQVNTSSAREDVDGTAIFYPGQGVQKSAYPLEAIKVTTGSYCSQWDFSYDYFESNNVDGKSENKRLQLLSIQQKSCNNQETVPPYTFEYEGITNSNGSSFLPGRLSKATDHWGYYNGRIENQNFETNVPITVSTFLSSPFSFGNSFRYTDPVVMKYGVLNKMIYPTGGAVNFEFEANRYNESLSGESEKAYLQNCEVVDQTCCTSYNDETTISFVDSVEISNTKIDLNIAIAATAQICDFDNPGSGNDDCICTTEEDHGIDIEVWDVATNTLVGMDGVNFTNASAKWEDNITISLSSLGSIQANKLYRFKIIVNNGRGTARIYANYTQSVDAERPAGGLRIKEIRTSPDGTLGGNDIIRTYEYKDKNDPDLSSGVLRFMPKYAINQLFQSIIGLIPGNGEIVLFQDHSFTPLSAINGSHLEYKRVVERFSGNGYKEHIFDVFPGDFNLSIPTIPQQFKAGDGVLLESFTFNENDEQKARVRQVPKSKNYDYLSGTTFKVKNLGITCYYVAGGDTTNYPVILVEDYSNLTQTDNFYYIKSENELDGVETVTDYDYDNIHYDFPTEVTFTNSDGIVTTTNYSYPFDLPNGCLKDNFIDRNLVSIPLETTVSVDGVLLSGTRTDYSSFSDLNGLPVSCNSTLPPYPHEIFSYERTFSNGTPTAGAWNLVATLNEIDVSNGKPVQVTQRGWPAETLEWDVSNNMIKKRSFQDFEWSYEYISGTRMLSKITDVDGQFVTYNYDPLMRLQTSTARNGKVVSSYDYEYKNGSTPNYVKSTVTYDTIGFSAFSSLVEKTVYQYMDGLGRPIQTVDQQHSPGSSPKDIVRTITYDNQSRQSTIYEPFESLLSTGAYVQNVPSGVDYTLMTYYDSPLNRIQSQTAPDWYPVTTEYAANTGSEVPGYAENQLAKTILIDGNGDRSITFVDKKGRTILSRRTNADETLVNDTYNYYDDKDRLIKVQPPGASANDADLIFEYIYDNRDRIMSKKVPDQGWINYLYDNRNLNTFMQDANMALEGKWLRTIYDSYGRATQSGFTLSTPADGDATPNINELLTQASFYPITADIGTRTRAQQSRTRILGTNDWLEQNMTYDDYGRIENTIGNNYLNLGNLNADTMLYAYDFADNPITQNRIQIVNGVRTTVLDEMHYDHMGRLIANYHQVNGGTKQQLCEVDYTIKDEIKEKNIGKVSQGGFLQSLDFVYRENGFLESINPGNLGGTSTVLPISPALAALPNPGAVSYQADPDHNDLFHLQLHYDTKPSGIDNNVNIQKNGNIAAQEWQVRGRQKQSYGYQYDYLSRVLDATHYEKTSMSSVYTQRNYFDATFGYDLRGNIQNLSRNGLVSSGNAWSMSNIDALNYSYYPGSNRLKSVEDQMDLALGFRSQSASSGDYLYDDNGNMTYDPHKMMSIEYNYLNMPERILMDSCREIQFIYDATGSKLSKKIILNDALIRSKEYLGGIEYSSGVIEAIYHKEGRAYFLANQLRYEYNITDHLGNVRLSFTDKDDDGVIEVFDDLENTEVLQESQYYPFGMRQQGTWYASTISDNPYLYNGKELNEEFGLDWLSYGAREYDPALGRFFGVDPITEDFPWATPYNYAENKPVNGVDLWGLQWVSMHKWSDQVQGRIKGFTYRDLWGEQSFSIQYGYQQDGANYDCADFCIQQLVDFAYQNKLPIYFEDHKAEGVDPTFSNDAYGYIDKQSREWVSIEEGDWESLAKAIQVDYGAGDLYGNRKLTTIFAEVIEGKDGIAFKNSDNFKNIKLGSLIGTKWKSGGHHSQTINWLRYKDGSLKNIGLFNGTTAYRGGDNPVVAYRYYSFIDDILKLSGRFDDAGHIQFMEWNFSRFDNKSRQ